MKKAEPFMIWLLYNVLFAVGFLVMLPYYLWRMCRRGGYARGFMQRVGVYPRELRHSLREGGRVWVQAVSVGELRVALQWMKDWKQRRPDVRFVLSTNTSTAYALAKRELAPEDLLIYFPLDFSWIMERVLRLVNPRALVLIECELWPNLIRRMNARGRPVVLINGRVSERSYRGYRRLLPFTRRILGMVDLLCVQSTADERRVLALGAPGQRVLVMGSAKYDAAPADPGLVRGLEQDLASAGLAQSKIWLGGSTWPGEEEALLECFLSLRPSIPGLMLALAPRHVERAPDILNAIQRRGLAVLRRSRMRTDPPDAIKPDVLLIDTTGELSAFYAHADLIFIGKSLTARGGQNPIEPALYGKPILAGPHLENFPVVKEDFLAAQAMVQVEDAAALCREARRLLNDPAARAELGERAIRLVREKAGALAVTLERVDPLLDTPSAKPPCLRPSHEGTKGTSRSCI